jgi:hypothetical protein
LSVCFPDHLEKKKDALYGWLTKVSDAVVVSGALMLVQPFA